MSKYLKYFQLVETIFKYFEIVSNIFKYFEIYHIFSNMPNIFKYFKQLTCLKYLRNFAKSAKPQRKKHQQITKLHPDSSKAFSNIFK